MENGGSEAGVIRVLLLLETDDLPEFRDAEGDVSPLSGKRERLGRGSLEVAKQGRRIRGQRGRRSSRPG